MKNFLIISFAFFLLLFAQSAKAVVLGVNDDISIADNNISVPLTWTNGHYAAPFMFSNKTSPHIITATTTYESFRDYIVSRKYRIDESGHGYTNNQSTWAFFKKVDGVATLNPSFYSWGGSDFLNCGTSTFVYVAIAIGDNISESPADNYYVFRYYVDATGAIHKAQSDIEVGNVSVISLPNTQRPVYIASENIEWEKEKYCRIGEECKMRVNYRYEDIGRTVSIIPFEATSSSEISDSKLLEEQPLATIYLEPDSPSGTTTQEYCYILSDEFDNETWYCSSVVHWVNVDLETLLEFEPYDITKACDEVTPSDESLWDNFRYGVECGFQKVVYWSFHPRTKSWQKLDEAKNDLLDEFPLNIYNVLWYNMYEASTGTTTPFELKMYMGGFNTQDVTMWSSDDLTGTLGTTWDRIYTFMRVFVYFFTIVYFINYFVKPKETE